MKRIEPSMWIMCRSTLHVVSSPSTSRARAYRCLSDLDTITLMGLFAVGLRAQKYPDNRNFPSVWRLRRRVIGSRKFENRCMVKVDVCSTVRACLMLPLFSPALPPGVQLPEGLEGDHSCPAMYQASDNLIGLVDPSVIFG